ncbi:hypothetical protein Naga_102396g1 [Nannochloropsis gaditana]|uniref:Uncharacterized protein n=1 Tax=Nannochloropsis gaditana TaxID=72520 RepID=W7TIC6_9STRA|nr:hypothetical protein Naga_102396g1 [Nannochloropsis gaditana]
MSLNVSFYMVSIYIKVGPRILILLFLLLRSAGSSPLFTFVHKRGLIRLIVLSEGQLDLALEPLHLRLPKHFGHRPLVFHTRDVCFRLRDLRRHTRDERGSRSSAGKRSGGSSEQ